MIWTLPWRHTGSDCQSTAKCNKNLVYNSSKKSDPQPRRLPVSESASSSRHVQTGYQHERDQLAQSCYTSDICFKTYFNSVPTSADFTGIIKPVTPQERLHTSTLDSFQSKHQNVLKIKEIITCTQTFGYQIFSFNPNYSVSNLNLYLN